MLWLIVKMTYFRSGMWWVWLTALCERVRIKSVKDHLYIISGLCQTHCKQVPESLIIINLMIISCVYVLPSFRQPIGSTRAPFVTSISPGGGLKTTIFTHKHSLQFLPMGQYGLCSLIFFFLVSLLQRSHRADHHSWVQIRESLFYNKLQILQEPS